MIRVVVRKVMKLQLVALAKELYRGKYKRLKTFWMEKLK